MGKITGDSKCGEGYVVCDGDCSNCEDNKITSNNLGIVVATNEISLQAPLTRLDWLRQDRDKLIRFINMIASDDYDCQNCPFMREDGMLYGCNAGHGCTDEDTYDEIDCQLNYEDATDFLAEEMPTEEQMDKWKGEFGNEV